MNVISFQPTPEQPDEESYRLFPDFLITTLLHEGIGRIEATYPSSESEYVPFHFKPRRGNTEKQIAEIGRHYFRSVLAHLAHRCKIENLYAGQTFFACSHIVNGEPKTHRFSLFICNENQMGYWLILYLYGIDLPTTQSTN